MLRSAIAVLIFVFALALSAASQSGHRKNYSESVSRFDRSDVSEEAPKPAPPRDDDVIRIETDLITIPIRVTTRGGQPVPDIKQSEFRIYENGEPQEIAYFTTDEAPFTVALLLDMSYSSVFKLKDIQNAALEFLTKLKPNDRVMVVSFSEKVKILCEPTSDRRALRYAIEGSQIGSGTSVYDAMSETLDQRLRKITGRKAIVMLSDGVDTTSKSATMRSVLADLDETDTLVYPIQYNTFDDVLKNRKKDAQILYDDDDRPYVADTPPAKGERAEDYAEARDFFQQSAERTGGRVQKVNSTTNLSDAFTRIADELRKTYSLGYYPTSERKPGTKYYIRVRVYRPDLVIRARETYLRPSADK